jgi:ADP-ribose pyrophosphatase YjhB (NUDIX family)
VKDPPKKMLIELPAADEIDDLAITTPKFEVRKFEFDLTDAKADLRYPPCKAQAVLVVRGPHGTALAMGRDGSWTVPSGRVGATEEIPGAAKRVAREDFGLSVRSMELAGVYDVIWHYSDMTVKRLHFVYAAVTDDEPNPKARNRVRIFQRPEESVKDDISKSAIADCKEK